MGGIAEQGLIRGAGQGRYSAKVTFETQKTSRH